MYRLYIALILMVIAAGVVTQPASGYWVWTPGSSKWENPRYAAKDTPEEQLEYAMAFYEQKNYKMAPREFKKLIKHYPLSKEAPTSQYYLGRIMEDLDKPYEAFKAYQKVIDLYPYTELVDEVIEREYKIGDLFFSGRKYQILGPLKMPAQDKAIEILKTVAENAPYGKYAEPAMFKTGMAHKQIADYDNAIMMFKGLIDSYPNSEFIDRARYQLAECSKLMSLRPDYDQTPTIVAREEFEDFIEKHPDSEMSKEAREIVDDLRLREAQNAYKIAEFYESRHKPESAVIYYRDIIQKYPGTELARKAKERLDAIRKE
ncbi:MAG: outer membrane protein assembly factor BamD [Candidatus Omnitrophica bacterium]|nr:outer membrane protein assembly factor BamD [Candidatus Omnitrophota bacterium]